MGKVSKKRKHLKRQDEVRKNTVPRTWNGETLNITPFPLWNGKNYQVKNNGKKSDIFYCSIFVGSFYADCFLAIGNYLLLKSAGQNLWSLFHKKETANKKFVKEGNLFIHQNKDGFKNIIFFDAAKKEIDSISAIKIDTFENNYLALEHEYGYYTIVCARLPFMLDRQPVKENRIKIFKSKGTEEKIAFLSLSDGFYKRLGSPTKRMVFCNLHNLKYKIQSFSDLTLYLKARLLDFINLIQ